MGDNFFQLFFIGMFVLIGLVGLISFLHMEKKATDYREQRAYIESRGASEMPASWRDRVGGGI